MDIETITILLLLVKFNVGATSFLFLIVGLGIRYLSAEYEKRKEAERKKTDISTKKNNKSRRKK